jgi:hypothetical protein
MDVFVWIAFSILLLRAHLVQTNALLVLMPIHVLNVPNKTISNLEMPLIIVSVFMDIML